MTLAVGKDVKNQNLRILEKILLPFCTQNDQNSVYPIVLKMAKTLQSAIGFLMRLELIFDSHSIFSLTVQRESRRSELSIPLLHCSCHRQRDQKQRSTTVH